MVFPSTIKDHPRMAFWFIRFCIRNLFYHSITKCLHQHDNRKKTLVWQITIYLLDIYTGIGYNDRMIKSFADRETERVFNQSFSRKLPQSIQRVALRKLIMIHNAGCLEDLRVPPANHLEPLHGDREGQYSIRINDQYRICFTVEGNNFFHVEIVDYH